MSDINRLPVDCFVLHHAVTPLWPNRSRVELAQFFSDSGFARAYGSNESNWSGLINPYTGGRSYSQAHLAGQQVDASTPDATQAERDAGFRWVELVADIWGQICWHAGNWEMNRKSIGIEMLGDYRNYTLRDWDARVLGAFWRPQDLSFGGATAIYGHREVSDSSTECPARIMEMRDTVVEYCNNPPSPVHVPVVINLNETSTIAVPFTSKTIEDNTKDFDTILPGTNGVRTITYSVTSIDGVETNRTVTSDVTIQPIMQVTIHGTYVKPEPIPEPTPDPVPEPTPEPTPVPNKDSWLNKLLRFIFGWIINKIKGVK